MSPWFQRLGLLAAAALLSGCSSKSSRPAPVSGKLVKQAAELGEEELFQRGKDLIERGKEDDGRVFLRRYEQRYPKGPHIEETKLLIAESFFRAGEIDQQVEGVALYRQFLTFYPQTKLACKAQLRIGEYYFSQMHSCERDQTETRQAVEEFQKLIATYPDCPDLGVARDKLNRAYDRLACAEQKVAEFYRRTGQPRAASHRYADLLRNYPEYTQRCEVRLALIELYEKLGQIDEARGELARMEEQCAGKEELSRALRKLGMTRSPGPAAAPAKAAPTPAPSPGPSPVAPVGGKPIRG